MAMEEKSRRALDAMHGSRYTHAALSHQLSQKEGSSEHKLIAGTSLHFLHSFQFSSVQCPTLCDPMDCSMPGSPAFHHLPELAQTHVHRVNDAIQPSHPLSSPSPPTFNLFQHQGLFQSVSSSHQVAKVLEFQLQHLSFR